MKYTTHSGKSASPHSTVKMLNMDDMSSASDEELQGVAGALYDEMKAKHISLGSTQAQAYETELAYIQRELELRWNRKAAHRNWMETQRFEYVDERHLPEYSGNFVPEWILARLDHLQ